MANGAGVREAGETMAEPEAFRLAMRQLASQVCIIGSGRGERLTGMTVTSVTSLCVEPPAVSLAVARTASIHPVLAETGRFGLSGLTADHVPLANRFAGRDGSKGTERFSAGRWDGLDTGFPVLDDANFALSCVVDEMIDWHSHSIVVARVVSVRSRVAAGLVYREGGFGLFASAGAGNA